MCSYSTLVEQDALMGTGRRRGRLLPAAGAGRQRRARPPRAPAGRLGPCTPRTPAGPPARPRPCPWAVTGRTRGTSRPRRSCRRGRLIWPAATQWRLRMLRLRVCWALRRGKGVRLEPVRRGALGAAPGCLWRGPAAAAGCSACTARLCAAWGPPPSRPPADQPAPMQVILMAMS